MKTTERVEGEVVFDDYPVNKYARKIDWWTSDKGIELIAGWRSAGATIKEIYERMGVDKRTFNTWRKKCPKLADALDTSKEIAIVRVENALFKRAVGYDYNEVTRELVEGEMRVTKVVTKHVPGDTKAMLAFLFNRNSQNWRAMQEPLDSNTPAIANADDVLVRIREAAENTSEGPLAGLPLASDVLDGSTPGLGFEPQGEAKKNVGENPDGD